MTNHGKVRSVQQPEQIVIDDYSVWLAANITKVAEPGTVEQPGFDGWEYDLTQYTKDEFILNQAVQNQEINNLMNIMLGVNEE